MGVFTRGEVLVVKFPFTDLTGTKVRPALCLAGAGRGDFVLCQITSISNGPIAAIQLDSADFAYGGLRLLSFARPEKLFTANEAIIERSIGRLTPLALDRVVAAVVQVLQPSNKAAP